MLSAGKEWEPKIFQNLERADCILLLVSADSINSDYSFDNELQFAMIQHQTEEALVIPIILRPCNWQNQPFGKLQVLPSKAKPIIKWDLEDDGWLDVTNGIKQALTNASQKIKEFVREQSATKTAIKNYLRPYKKIYPQLVKSIEGFQKAKDEFAVFEKESQKRLKGLIKSGMSKEFLILAVMMELTDRYERKLKLAITELGASDDVEQFSKKGLL